MTFSEELAALCARHNVHLSGTLRVIDTADGRWNLASRSLEVKDSVEYGDVTDTTGPFLVAAIGQHAPEPVEIKADLRIHVSPDIAGYDCPVTGKWIDGRSAHRENLKRRGCRNLEPGESRDGQKNQERIFNEGCKRSAREMVAAVAHQFEV